MYKVLLIVLLILPIFSGCSGVQTFPNVVRAGETAAIGMGWQKKFKRSNTTVTITPSSGAPVIYQPENPAVRAIINLYPDPVSWLVIGTETNQDAMFNFGATYGTIINNTFTNGDKDWWQTISFIDLPDNFPTGTATIEFTNEFGEQVFSIVEIVDGIGEQDQFIADRNGPLTSIQLSSLERSPNYEVSFSSSFMPFSIQITLGYDSAYQVPYIMNTRGDLKNIMWTDNQNILKIMVVPTKLELLKNINDFKFYVAGGIENLTVIDITAFDIDGNPISGVFVTLN